MRHQASRSWRILSAGTIAAGLAGAPMQPCSAAAGTTPSHVPDHIPEQPAVTGSMYNGNNTAPSDLTLQGLMGPITRVLERTETAPPNPSGQVQQPNATLGGNSGNARSGGGG